MKKITLSAMLLVSAVTPALASNAENFSAHDPIGWMMAVISMGVVFVALLILFLCFKYGYTGIAAIALRIKKLFHRQQQLEIITEKRSKRVVKVADAASGEVVADEELAAAIGVALFLHEDGMHDAESDVLTLADTTSAWRGAGQNQKHSPVRRF
ncbi:MAG: OadG family protein [Bacteroidales bacterium]|nr:OadG family protein [Bacteroidales bacterium]